MRIKMGDIVELRSNFFTWMGEEGFQGIVADTFGYLALAEVFKVKHKDGHRLAMEEELVFIRESTDLEKIIWDIK